MPIDWSKYGVNGGTSGSSKTSVDFSKYVTKQEPQYEAGYDDRYDEPLIPTEPDTDPRNAVEKGLDYIFKENPVSRALNYIPAKIAQYAVPDAPYIDMPDTNVREDFAKENPIPSSGNETFDKIGDVVGQFVGPFVGTKGTGTGEVANIASAAFDKYLPNAAAKLADFAEGRIARSVLNNAPAGAVGNVEATLATQEPTGENLADSAWQGALLGGALGGVGRTAGIGLEKIADKYAGTKIGDILGRFIDRPVPEPEPNPLALPSPRVEDRMNAASQRGDLDYGAEPIANPYTFKLNEPSEQTISQIGNLTDAHSEIRSINDELKNLDSRYQQAINDQYKFLKGSMDNRGGVVQGSLLRDEHGDVIDRVGRTSNNPQWYQDFYAENSRKPTNKELYQLAKKHVDEGFQDDVGVVPSWKMENGHDETVQALTQVRDQLRQHIRENGLGLTDAQLKTQEFRAANPLRQEEPAKVASAPSSNPTPLKPSVDRPMIQSERGFNTTVRTSEKTPESLSGALESTPGRYKVKPNEVLMQDAHKTIERMGEEGAYNFVMASRTVNDKVNAVAQILARRASENGNLERAIDLVSKTAQRGTELGRAIQALSLWNRMDAEGALLVGERQLNRGIKNPADYVKLTPEQAKPIIAATDRVKTAENTKSLAQEVMDIVANKKPGEQLTDGELAKIKQFQQEVNQINSKVKGFFPDKAVRNRKVIEEVNKIDPKDRTISQLQDYWEARAERARQKLAKQRNIGLLADTENPVLLYAELGVAKLAKGFLSAAEFADSMVKDYGNNVKGIANQVYERSVNLFRKSQGLPTTSELNQVVSRALRDKTLDDEAAANFRNWASQIAFYTDETMKKEAVQDLQLALKALGRPTIGQRISSIQTQAQLLSVPTVLRNISGNELFNIAEKINKIAAVPIDWTLSKLTGERTLKFVTHNQESYFKNWLTGTKSAWKGVNPDGALSKHDMYPSAFSGKYNPFTYTEKALGVSLQSFDYAAYKRAEGEVLHTWASHIAEGEGLKGEAFTARMNDLVKNAPDAIQKLAEEAGKYATFQDDTVLSKAFVGAKNLLNKVGVDGFGLGDIVLKYAKTPANIIMRSIDYSPAGLIRGFYMLTKPLVTKKSGFDQRATALALSRGITGTLGMTGLGYILAARGIISGSAPTDRDVRDLQKKVGQNAYQVNLSALKRWIMSGFDDNQAAKQQGDTLMNYDWLAPAAMSLAMGANANQDVTAKKKGQVDKTGVEIAVNAITGGLKTIMEQPLLTGVSNLFNIDTKQDNWAQKKAMDTISGVPASFVPALSGQLRNATDNTARSTYDPNQWQSMMNQVINRIPWLSAKLPIAYDTLGKPRDVIQGGQSGSVKQFLNTFVNPAKVTNYNVSPDAKLVVDLLNSSGDNRVAPRDVDKTLTVNKQKIKLSGDQYEQLQQSTGQYTSQMLQRISPMLQNPNIKDDSKVKAVVDVLSKAGERARNDLQKQMGVTPQRR